MLGENGDLVAFVAVEDGVDDVGVGLAGVPPAAGSVGQQRPRPRLRLLLRLRQPPVAQQTFKSLASLENLVFL